MTLGVPNVQVSSTNCPLIQQVTEPSFGSLVTDDVSALSVWLLKIAQRLLGFAMNHWCTLWPQFSPWTDHATAWDPPQLLVSGRSPRKQPLLSPPPAIRPLS